MNCLSFFKTVFFKEVIVLLLCGSLGMLSCGSDSGSGASNNNYGVPEGVDLSAPCPANGTWLTNTPKKMAKAADADFSARFDGRFFLEDWRFDVELMAWKNTGVCMWLQYVYACDFESYYSGESLFGYIDPNTAATDANGRKVYTGYTTSGLTFQFSDQNAPAKLYIRIDMNGDGEYHDQFLTLEP